MAPPKWSYQVDNFVTKPDDELVCSVCHSVFREPVRCPCGHDFCKACITSWLRTSSSCPICRKPVTSRAIVQVVPNVKNLIMKLIIYCRNKEHGCEAQFTLESCENHMKECSFELVQCKNKPCKEKIFRKDVEEHETNGCPHRYVKCKTSGSTMAASTPSEGHNCISARQQRLRTVSKNPKGSIQGGTSSNAKRPFRSRSPIQQSNGVLERNISFPPESNFEPDPEHANHPDNDTPTDSDSSPEEDIIDSSSSTHSEDAANDSDSADESREFQFSFEPDYSRIANQFSRIANLFNELIDCSSEDDSD